MADQESKIKFILEASDNASATISTAADNMKTKLEGATTAIAALGAASTAALALSVKGFMDEDEAITKAARATADAAGGFDNAKKSITELNAKMEEQGFSTDQTTEAMDLLVNKAGVDFQTALKESGDLMAYAESRKMSLARAIKIYTGEEKENQEAIDKTSSALQDAQATLEKYGAEIESTATATAITVGEERALRDLHISEERAQRSLNDAISDQKEKADALQEAIKKNGEGSKEATAAQNQLETASKKVTAAHERLTDVQTNLNDKISDLASRQTDSTGKMNEASQKYEEAKLKVAALTGEMEKLNTGSEKEKKSMEGALALREKTETVQDRLTKTSEKFGNIMEKIGEKLMPVVEAVLNFANGLMDGFNALDKPTQDLLVSIGAVVAVILSIAGAIAAVVGPLAPFIGSFMSLGSVIAGVVGFIGSAVAAIGTLIAALNPVGLVILAIIAVIIGLKLAWDANLFGIQEVVGNFIAWIQNNLGTILAGIIMLPLAPLLALKAAWDSNLFGIQDSVTGFVTNITTAISTFIADIKLRWETWIAGLLKGIKDFGTNVITEVGKFVKGITDAFVALIAKGLEWGGQLVSNVLKGIIDKASEMSAAVSSVASAIWDLLMGGGKKPTTGATGLVATGVRPLAAGGIVSSPTMALLGEGGENEYVIPESKMRSWLGGGGATTIYVTVNEASSAQATAEMVWQRVAEGLGAANSTSMVSPRT